MPDPALDIEHVVRGSELYREQQQQSRGEWELEELSGRVVELSGHRASASLTAAIRLVHRTQSAGEPVAWVTGGEAMFYPPDAAEHGIDLRALPIIRAGDPKRAGRAADKLLRSGAFGLVVLDLAGNSSRTARKSARGRTVPPDPLMRRLQNRAEEHDTALVCLTSKPPDASSLGSFVSLRALTRRKRVGDNRFTCRIEIVRDKRRGPGWDFEEECCGPPGLR